MFTTVHNVQPPAPKMQVLLIYISINRMTILIESPCYFLIIPAKTTFQITATKLLNRTRCSIGTIEKLIVFAIGHNFQFAFKTLYIEDIMFYTYRRIKRQQSPPPTRCYATMYLKFNRRSIFSFSSELLTQHTFNVSNK
jgi:hypothetical protein